MVVEPVPALVLHGAVVLLLGIVAGFPFWLTILLRRTDEIRPWRVAHSTLVLVGLMLLVVGLILPYVEPGDATRDWLVWSLVASGYGFTFALILGALAKERGLNPWPIGPNTGFFLGHLIGALGSLIGIGLLVFALIS